MLPERSKILFYIHSLAGGGAERVWSVLASAFAARSCDVILAVDTDAAENKHSLHPDVRLVVLGAHHGRAILRLSRLLRTERPDVAASALAASNLKLVLAGLLAGCRRRVVVSFHGYAENEPQRLSTLAFRLAPVLSRLAARTVCVSNGLLAYLRRRWIPVATSLRIYNPVVAPSALARRDTSDRPPMILAAGRLTEAKDFAGLVQALAAMTTPNVHLTIVGDGPQRAAIVAETERLGLSNRVTLPGYVIEPWAYFAQADCFVLPSRFEAFGLVVVEALAHGLPVVATACDGPREILDGGVFGTLVTPGDVTAMAAALDAALADPGPPEPRTARAAEFSVETAVARYAQLFRSVAAQATASDARRRSHPPATAAPRVSAAAATLESALKISIVVTNYNYARYLTQCLDSVAAQTYRHVECIVVDDGSTDESREILARYPGFTTILQGNAGHARAARRGFAETTGQIVVFLDSDDFLLPDACATIAQLWEPDLTALHYRLQVYRDGGFEHSFRPEGSFRPEHRISRVLRLGSIPAAPTSGNAYARTYVDLLFREASGLDRNSIDSALAFSAPIAGRTAFYERALGAYRIHANNDSMWGRRRPLSAARMGLFYGYHAQRTARRLAAARDLKVPSWNALNGAYELKLYLTIRGAAVVEALGLPKRAPLACAVQAARAFVELPGLPPLRRLANVAIVFGLALMPFALRRRLGERFYNLDFAS